MSNYAHVINYISKAEQTTDLEPIISAKLKVNVEQVFKSPAETLTVFVCMCDV